MSHHGDDIDLSIPLGEGEPGPWNIIEGIVRLPLHFCLLLPSLSAPVMTARPSVLKARCARFWLLELTRRVA